MKRQATYHGEIGVNGKAYTKGQFIAEQPMYLGKAASFKKAKVRKQEIEPYVWELPEDEHLAPIFRFLSGAYAKYNHATKQFLIADDIAQICNFHNVDIKKIECLIARFNIGERWYFPSHEIYA